MLPFVHKDKFELCYYFILGSSNIRHRVELYKNYSRYCAVNIVNSNVVKKHTKNGTEKRKENMKNKLSYIRNKDASLL